MASAGGGRDGGRSIGTGLALASHPGDVLCLLGSREIARLAGDELTVVLSTYDPDHALAIGTRVVLQHEGGIRATGLPQAALTGPSLSAVYGVEVLVERLADGRAACLPSLARQGPSQRTTPVSPTS
jgi:hypothetical protein